MLRCTCHGCKSPFAIIANGTLIIESTHHGKKHQNTVSIAYLVAVMDILKRKQTGDSRDGRE